MSDKRDSHRDEAWQSRLNTLWDRETYREGHQLSDVGEWIHFPFRSTAAACLSTGEHVLVHVYPDREYFATALRAHTDYLKTLPASTSTTMPKFIGYGCRCGLLYVITSFKHVVAREQAKWHKPKLVLQSFSRLVDSLFLLDPAILKRLEFEPEDLYFGEEPVLLCLRPPQSFREMSERTPPEPLALGHLMIPVPEIFDPCSLYGMEPDDTSVFFRLGCILHYALSGMHRYKVPDSYQYIKNLRSNRVWEERSLNLHVFSVIGYAIPRKRFGPVA